MSFNMILLVLGVVFGVAYFAKRSHRKQKEMKMRAKQRQA
jgi:cytochrome c oxidase assembly factor CtaG